MIAVHKVYLRLVGWPAWSDLWLAETPLGVDERQLTQYYLIVQYFIPRALASRKAYKVTNYTRCGIL